MSGHTSPRLRELGALTNTILRFVLSGGVFLLMLALLRKSGLGFLNFPSSSGDVSLYITSLVIVVSGAVIYTIHRGLLYYAVLALLFGALRRRRGLKESWRHIDRKLTRLRSERRDKDEAIQQHFDRIGAEVHFLYTSAWAGIAAVLFCQFQGTIRPERTPIVVMATVVFFVAAVVHDWNLGSEEIRLAYNGTTEA